MDQQELNESVNPLPVVPENLQQELINHRPPLPENLRLPQELRLV